MYLSNICSELDTVVKSGSGPPVELSEPVTGVLRGPLVHIFNISTHCKQVCHIGK